MLNLYLCIVFICIVVYMNSFYFDENKDIFYFGVKLCDINIFYYYICLIFILYNIFSYIICFFIVRYLYVEKIK